MLIMVSLRVEYIISLCLAGLYYLYLIISQILQSRKKSSIVQEEPEELEKETLNDVFQEQDMIAIREQLAIVENTSSESVSTPSQGPLTIHQDEDLLITEGERLYSELNEELFDSTPRTISEKQEDLADLMKTIENLESLDLSHYHPDEEKAIDMGTGMFYDSISQKLTKIIKAKEFKKLPFVQAEKLESYAFQSIKNIKHNDYRETLKIMKEVYAIKEIVLINEMTTLLNFSKTPIDLSLPEKVVIFYMSNHFPTKLAGLQEFTQWKPNYLNQILEGLIEKNYILMEDNIYTAPGLISEEEYHALQEQFDRIKLRDQKKKEEAKQLAIEKKKLEEKLKTKQEKEEKQKLQEQQDRLLQEARKKAQKDAERARAQAEKLTEQEEIERLEKIKSMPKPKIQVLPSKSVEEEEDKSKEKRAEETPNPEYNNEIGLLQQILDHYEESTGGLIVFQALKYYGTQAGLTIDSDEDLYNILEEMKKRELIFYDIEQGGVHAYFYGSIKLSEDMITLLQQFILHAEMNYSEMETALGWKIQQIEPIIKFFYENNIIKYNQKEKFYFPGLFNTQ